MHKLLQHLYQSPRIDEPIVLRRLPAFIELLLLATLCLQLTALNTFGSWVRLGAWPLLVILLVLAIHPGHTWIPFCPAFVSIAACLFAFRKQPQATREVAVRKIRVAPDTPAVELVEPAKAIMEENKRAMIKPEPGKKSGGQKSPEPETAKKSARTPKQTRSTKGAKNRAMRRKNDKA